MNSIIDFSEAGFTIVGMNFWSLTCAMMFYSFIGWFYESTIFSLVEQGKIMNRGCFVGPYCPIYSVVSILNIYLLDGVTSPFKIVVLSCLTCCLVEYVTSVALEKIFHARYWDYSYFPLNINGRVSVFSGLFFGFAVLFLIKILHPLVLITLSKMSPDIIYYLALFFWAIFIFDAIFTTIGMCNLNRKCKELYDAWDNYVEGKLDVINSKKDLLSKFVIVEKSKDLVVKLKGFNTKFVDLETRYLKAVPDFKSTKYGAVLDKAKEALKKNKTILAEYDDLEQLLLEEINQNKEQADNRNDNQESNQMNVDKKRNKNSVVHNDIDLVTDSSVKKKSKHKKTSTNRKKVSRK